MPNTAWSWKRLLISAVCAILVLLLALMLLLAKEGCLFAYPAEGWCGVGSLATFALASPLLIPAALAVGYFVYRHRLRAAGTLTVGSLLFTFFILPPQL